MGLADVVGARLRQPEMLHLAFRDKLLDRACDLFHRHIRVDTVLVEKVEDRSCRPLTS